LSKKAQRTARTRTEPAAGPGVASLGSLARFPVERAQRAAEQVYRNLRRSIILGELAAGSRLREVEVAAAMKVSRTPVREAVSRLIGDGLVRELATGGVEVVDASAELFELYHIREALEGCAARLAAMRIGADQLARLAALNEEAHRTHYSEMDERIRINQDFHLTIARAAGSQRLFDLIGGFREFFMNVEWLRRFDQKGSAKQSLKDHRAILEALRARAPGRAERLVREHLRTVYAGLLADRSRPA
jgi:DNA-binding GntR family transcriptional regulator